MFSVDFSERVEGKERESDKETIDVRDISIGWFHMGPGIGVWADALTNEPCQPGLENEFLKNTTNEDYSGISN